MISMENLDFLKLKQNVTCAVNNTATVLTHTLLKRISRKLKANTLQVAHKHNLMTTYYNWNITMIDNLEVFNKVNSLFTSTQLTLINHYIEYLNLYLSIEGFAADKGISVLCAGAMIDEGRELQTLYSDLYNQIVSKNNA